MENAELDALEADMDFESESVPSYLQPDQESELNLPAAPTGHAAVPANQQQVVELLWEKRMMLDVAYFDFSVAFIYNHHGSSVVFFIFVMCTNHQLAPRTISKPIATWGHAF